MTDLNEIATNLNPLPRYEKNFVLKVSEIIKACHNSKSLMTSIYLMEKEHFLYYSDSLKTIVGTNGNCLLKKGWTFWFSKIDQSELVWVQRKFKLFFTAPYMQELLTLKYHISNFLDNRICIKHEILLHRVAGQTLAINYFFDETDRERIENQIESSEQKIAVLPSKQEMPISAREKEVLHLIADGYSSKEIASMLYISNHTAISHRKNLIEKFKVKNTAHLIKKAFRYSYL